MSEKNGEELPAHWMVSLLIDISQVNPRLDRSIESDDVVVDFVPMRAVEPEGGGLLRPEVSTYGKVKKGYTAFQSGDVIMAKITPCMENGKTCVVPELPGAACFGSTEFHVVRAEQGIDPRWIANYLLQHSTRHAAQRQMAGGVGQMRVPASFLDGLGLPVPPTSEQSRILDAIDELLSDLDAGVAALERVRAKLKQYRAAVLMAAVEGALTGDRTHFVDTPLAVLIEGLGQGWSPKCDLARDPYDDEWAIIKTTAVQSMKYVDGEAKPLPVGLAPRPHIEIKPGDMLMTRKGPRQRAGVACLVRETRPRRMICDTVYRFHCKTKLVQPDYLELALNSPRVVAAIDRKKSGINDSGVSLTHFKLGEVQIPIPPLPLQASIVEAVEDQLSVIDHSSNASPPRERSVSARPKPGNKPTPKPSHRANNLRGLKGRNKPARGRAQSAPGGRSAAPGSMATQTQALKGRYK